MKCAYCDSWRSKTPEVLPGTDICPMCAFAQNEIGGHHPREILKRIILGKKWMVYGEFVTTPPCTLNDLGLTSCGAYDDDNLYVYVVHTNGMTEFYQTHFTHSDFDSELFDAVELYDGDEVFAHHDHDCAGATECLGDLCSFIRISSATPERTIQVSQKKGSGPWEVTIGRKTIQFAGGMSRETAMNIAESLFKANIVETEEIERQNLEQERNARYCPKCGRGCIEHKHCGED